MRGPVSVLARPEALRLADGDTATVELVEYYGHDTLYVVRLDGADTVRVRSGAGPRWRRGDRVAVTHAGTPATAWPASWPVRPRVRPRFGTVAAARRRQPSRKLGPTRCRDDRCRSAA